MKPSELPKNARMSVRLNQEIKEIIQNDPTLSAQAIFDEWVDAHVKVQIGPEKPKRGPGRPRKS